MMNRNRYFFIVLTIVALYSFFPVLLRKEAANSQEPLLAATAAQYYRNRGFMFNGNLVQYSSYVVAEQRVGEFSVAVMVTWFLKPKSTDDFVCLIRIENEVVEMKPFDVPKMKHNRVRKVVCQFEASSFNNTRSFNLSDVVVAVVDKKDFDKSLNLQFFRNASETVLPYMLINYQIPNVMRREGPLKDTVGMCVHFVYDSPPLHTITWVEWHLSFGIAEIQLYDSTDNYSLTRLLSSRFSSEDRVNVTPFFVNETDVCDEETLTKTCRHVYDGACPSTLANRFTENCLRIYASDFKNKTTKRPRFNQLTINDCFTAQRLKYAYVAVFDLDEMVFPRRMEEPKSEAVCENACQNQPFALSYSDYLKKLLNKYAENEDHTKIHTIAFSNAVYMVPDHVENQLIENLGQIVKQLQSSTSLFPLKLSLINQSGLIFEIQKDDANYARQLYQDYQQATAVASSQFKNLTVDSVFYRYLYFITPENLRASKCIFNSENTRTVYTHSAPAVAPYTWEFFPDQSHGHNIAHFRASPYEKLFGKNVTLSIRNLKIDLEYVSFLLKKFTHFCEKC